MTSIFESARAGAIASGAATAILGLLAIRWMHRWIKRAQEEGGKILEAEDCARDIVAAIGGDASDQEALCRELCDAMRGECELETGLLASILRIEESYEKRPHGKYLRRISVLRRKDDSTGSLVKVESVIGWEYVPDAVREEFIRTRRDKVARRIYDRKDAGAVA